MKKGKLIGKAAIYILLFLAAKQVPAQKKALLEIGQPMPAFVLRDVQYYYKNSVSLNDFKGKWLILDFWNRYCGVCVYYSIPHMDTLQRKFASKNLQVLLVGYTGSQFGTTDDKDIRILHEEQRKLRHLSLPIAYDSTLFHELEIRPTPYMVIINPEGKVKAVTTQITEAKLSRLIAGDTVSLKKAYQKGEWRKAKQDRLEGNSFRQYN